jgi:hypothetical protein
MSLRAGLFRPAFYFPEKSSKQAFPGKLQFLVLFWRNLFVVVFSVISSVFLSTIMYS